MGLMAFAGVLIASSPNRMPSKLERVLRDGGNLLGETDEAEGTVRGFTPRALLNARYLAEGDLVKMAVLAIEAKAGEMQVTLTTDPGWGTKSKVVIASGTPTEESNKVNGKKTITPAVAAPKCVCPNGVPVTYYNASFAECAANGIGACASCNVGYTLVNATQNITIGVTFGQCQMHECNCQNGVSAQAQACPVDNGPNCSSCNSNYGLVSTLCVECTSITDQQECTTAPRCVWYNNSGSLSCQAKAECSSNIDGKAMCEAANTTALALKDCASINCVRATDYATCCQAKALCKTTTYEYPCATYTTSSANYTIKADADQTYCAGGVCESGDRDNCCEASSSRLLTPDSIDSRRLTDWYVFPLETALKFTHPAGTSAHKKEGNMFEESSDTQEEQSLEFGAVGFGEVGGYFAQLLIYLCLGALYKRNVVDPMGKLAPQPPAMGYERPGDSDDFPIPLFGCISDPSYCLFSICCTPLRVAHTNEEANVCGFWETICCLWLTAPCGGYLCLIPFFRMSLKDHMGIHDNCFMDVLVTWCCMPCSIGQQAMSADQSLGMYYRCPCSVEGGFGGGPMGGQYMGIGAPGRGGYY
jgi:Cys-rich protein (TIGR01571 family)